MSNKQMVSVPRDQLQRAIDQLSVCSGPGPANRARELRELILKPAEQNHGEPVALPARREPVGITSTGGYSFIQAKKDRAWNACLDEIAKLGPLFSRPAQGEPVAYLITPPGCAAALIHAVDLTYRTEHAVPLYTHADPAEK